MQGRAFSLLSRRLGSVMTFNINNNDQDTWVVTFSFVNILETSIMFRLILDFFSFFINWRLRCVNIWMCMCNVCLVFCSFRNEGSCRSCHGIPCHLIQEHKSFFCFLFFKSVWYLLTTAIQTLMQPSRKRPHVRLCMAAQNSENLCSLKYIPVGVKPDKDTKRKC